MSSMLPKVALLLTLPAVLALSFTGLRSAEDADTDRPEVVAARKHVLAEKRVEPPEESGFAQPPDVMRLQQPDALPPEARTALQNFQRQQADIRSELQRKLAEVREATIRSLQQAQDQLTRAGNLDAAIAVREQVRRLQGQAPAAAGVETDPGNLVGFRGHVGSVHQFEVVGSTQGTIWGTDLYTDDSSLATAAVHAGILREGERGVVRVSILPGQASYGGSTRNGITSQPYAAWDGSYRVERGATPGGGTVELPRGPYPPVFPSLRIRSYSGVRPFTFLRNGGPRIVVMELVGSTDGQVWGSGPYTDDSAPAAAAVHAGVLKPGEKGMVRITHLPGLKSYRGSTQNGVTSADWQEWSGSFTIERIPTPSAPKLEEEPIERGPYIQPPRSSTTDPEDRTDGLRIKPTF